MSDGNRSPPIAIYRHQATCFDGKSDGRLWWPETLHQLKQQFSGGGDAAPELLRQSSESLAGRIAYYELPGLAVREVGFEHADRLWVRGGFPKAFLARSDRESIEWRQAFISSFQAGSGGCLSRRIECNQAAALNFPILAVLGAGRT